MAQYPGAVKTFTSKADGAGNKIFAAHINEIQDEVNAIEDGLLNGTAPVNSSRITAPALSVSAGSTLNELFVTVSPPSARVFSAVGLAVPDNTRTALAFASDRHVYPASMHSTGSNPSRIIAPSSGIYLATGHVTWALTTSATAQAYVELRVNGATLIAQQQGKTTENALAQSIASVYQLAASDYVELTVLQNTGSTASISVSTNASPELTLTKIR